jgi:hypothetical protein
VRICVHRLTLGSKGTSPTGKLKSPPRRLVALRWRWSPREVIGVGEEMVPGGGGLPQANIHAPGTGCVSTMPHLICEH